MANMENSENSFIKIEFKSKSGLLIPVYTLSIRMWIYTMIIHVLLNTVSLIGLYQIYFGLI